MSSIQIVEVATEIAGLSVTGLTDILDLDEMIDSFEGALPFLMPAPNFMLGMDPPEANAFGTHDVAPQTLNYTLVYRLFFAEVGEEEGLKYIYQGMADMVGLIQDVFTQNTLSSVIDIKAGSVGPFTVVTDPAGSQFHGVDIQVQVMEFIN